ncbi:TPA: YSIRK-type signal peptide-containing protein, partial [Streptococcus pyogenes]|nr:YSIRK-type signal peptide-containing protein [Streptococcus pyogenes]
MARENTNKHYSLRKLKKGTASVAVALSVIGAGLAVNQTEVSATIITRDIARDPDKLRKIAENFEVQNHQLTQEKEGLTRKNGELTQEKE